jgi:hypothetical protein
MNPDPPTEQRFRLHTAVLKCIARDAHLSQTLILRGASALRLFYGGLRDTTDLDFYVLNLPSAAAPATPDSVKPRLNAVLNDLLPAHFDHEPRWDEWLANIRIDLSACETVCECTRVNVGGTVSGRHEINVCTLEEILAEKLVAMIDPPMSTKMREQDLFDVANMSIVAEGRIDQSRVAELGSTKARHRQVRLHPGAFNDDIRARLASNYASVAQGAGRHFIPFTQAWARVVEFVGALPLK